MSIVTEQLLSFLGVDLAELDVYTQGRYAVIQRDPQPSEEEISQSTNIFIRIVDLEGDPSTASLLSLDVDIYLDGQLLLHFESAAATWGLGFSGEVLPCDPSAPYFYIDISAFQIVPPVFTSEQVVEARVVVNPLVPDLYTTYQFTIEDLTPPGIIGADPIDKHTVRVQFDDEMATTGPGSALRPEAYTIVTQNVDPYPGVTLEVVSVTEVDGSGSTQFDIEFQWEQTPGCQYEIQVDSSVTDSSGNGIQ